MVLGRSRAWADGRWENLVWYPLNCFCKPLEFREDRFGRRMKSHSKLHRDKLAHPEPRVTRFGTGHRDADRNSLPPLLDKSNSFRA